MELSRPLSTITPTMDGDLLAVLATAKNAFTTGELHVLLGRFSQEGVRKALSRLTGQGIVKAERVGRTYAYRLNIDHLAAGPIIQLAGLQQTLLTRITTRLTEWSIPPVYAAIFGSAARGSMTVDSDLDVLLVLPDGKYRGDWDDQVATLMDDIARWTGNDARPLEYTVTELENARDEPVLHDVLEEGLTVIGSRSWLARRIR